MVISSQIFKAPSLTSRPKLTKTNVSSSVFRGIKSSTVSSSSIRGIKSQISSSSTAKLSKEMDLDSEKIDDPKYLQPQISSIDQTLVETNNILVEIQKQLAFDYAMRIAEEKDAIKSIKEAESKRKFAAKEKSIEGIKKIGGAVGGTINKIAAPIKGIFDRIKEFFGLILTSLIASAAFKWLENEDNINNLINTFEFIGKTLPFLLGGLLTYKLIKWGKRFYDLGKFIVKLPGRIARFFGLNKLLNKLRAPSATQIGSKLLRPSVEKKAKSELAEKISNKGLSLAGKIVSDPKTGIRSFVSLTAKESDRLLKPNVFQKLMSGISGISERLTRKIIQPILDISLSKVPAPVRKKVGSAVASKGLKRFLPFVNTIFSSAEAFSRLMEGDIEGALISLAGAIPIVGWGAIALDIYRSVDPKGYQKNIRFGMSSDQLSEAIGEGFGMIGSMGFNRGGTVPGKGSGSVDSVNAMLAPGEEVVKTASARLFRPLLKDINDNAGRLWSAFSMGINKLMMVAKQQEDVNKEFARVIEDQERYQEQLKTEKLLKKVEGRGGGYRSPAKITPKAPKGGGNISMIPQSSGGMIFQPMVLPTQRSKPPQVPEMSGPATQAPNIASANPANPYMMLTPELYGILM